MATDFVEERTFTQVAGDWKQRSTFEFVIESHDSATLTAATIGVDAIAIGDIEDAIDAVLALADLGSPENQPAVSWKDVRRNLDL